MSNKVAVIKDPHFRLEFPPPVSRKDDYKETIYNKVNFIIEECRKRQVNQLIVTGDLFDKKYLKHYNSIAVKENIELLRHFKVNDIEVISIAGNHDLPYNSYDNVEDSLYGLVAKLGLITDISFKHITIGKHQIYGVPFISNSEDLFSHLDAINTYAKSNLLGGNIFVVLHEHFIPFDASLDDLKFTTFFRYTELMKYKAIDGFILGHLHRGVPIARYEYKDGNSQIFINQWSLYRLARNYYSSLDLHKPELVFLDLDKKEAETIIIPHLSFKDAFIKNKIKDEESDDNENVSVFVENLFEKVSGVEVEDIQGILSGIKDGEIKEIIISYLERVDN